MPIDRALTFGLDLARLDAHTRAQVLALLRRMTRELTARLDTHLTDWGRTRIEQQIRDATALINREYARISGHVIDTTTGVYRIAAVEANKTLAASSLAVSPSMLPTEAVMAALAQDALLLGAPQKAWWARQSLDVAFRFATALRRGLVAAETNAQIIKRVRAELDLTQRNAAALVQTSVQTVANNARLATFEANADVITGLRWLSTLDSHTCMQCAPRDGMTWRNDHSKLNAQLPFANPPLHYNCRCVLVPLTRFIDMPGAQRASTDGPVAARTTFEDFLERKGEAFQNEVLGRGRAELYRAGKITLTDLVNGQGRPLTLAQLRSKYE